MARGEWRCIAEPYLAAVAISRRLGGSPPACFSPSRHTHAPAPALAMASTMASRARARDARVPRPSRSRDDVVAPRPAPASRRLGAFLERPRRRGFTSAASPSRRDRVPFRSRNDPRVLSGRRLSPLAVRGVFLGSSRDGRGVAPVDAHPVVARIPAHAPRVPPTHPRVPRVPRGHASRRGRSYPRRPPGDSLLDPFMGSGTSLVVGMTRG